MRTVTQKGKASSKGYFFPPVPWVTGAEGSQGNSGVWNPHLRVVFPTGEGLGAFILRLLPVTG